MRQGSTKDDACAETFSQTYYTDNEIFLNSTVIYFDSNGNNQVQAGFYAKGIRVLQTNNNGEVIDLLTC
jgi:hypothetical protein